MSVSNRHIPRGFRLKPGRRVCQTGQLGDPSVHLRNGSPGRNDGPLVRTNDGTCLRRSQSACGDVCSRSVRENEVSITNNAWAECGRMDVRRRQSDDVS